jgi:hypothetical protein
VKLTVVASLGILALAAGCGGGGSSTKSVDEVSSCLRDSGAQVSTSQDDLDYVAQDATLGALKADIGATSVTVTFDRTEGDAKRTEAAYKIFAGALDVPIDDVLARQGATVVIWDDAPSDDEASQLGSCL